MIKVLETVEKYKNVQDGIARIHLASIKYPVINKSFYAVMLRYDGQRFECDGKGNIVKACYKAIRFCEKQKIKNVIVYSNDVNLLANLSEKYKTNSTNDLMRKEYIVSISCKIQIDWQYNVINKHLAKIIREKFMSDKKVVKNPSLAYASQDEIFLDAHAYVDGSYNPSLKKASYGLVMFLGKEVLEVRGMAFETDDKVSNYDGEIQGAIKAMEICALRGVKKLFLYYDFTGIKDDSKGKKKIKKVIGERYREYYRYLKDKVMIDFVKVKAHSGEKYNNRADYLAKQALKEYEYQNVVM